MKKLFTAGKLITLLLTFVFMSATTNSQAQSMKPSSSGYAPVNGTKLYYEVYGEGQPVVLLHGAYYTIQMNWGEMIPELAKNRKVIALELQGHGHSPYTDRKLSRETLATDVAQVLDYLHIDSADVVGYSFGGQVAYQFAIQHPTKLRKMVIISSVHKSTGWVPEIAPVLKNLKPELFEGSPLQTAYNAVAPDTTKWTEFLEQMMEAAAEDFDMGDENIAKITAPVLIISGDNDGMDKLELAKTYKLLGGGVSAGISPMPKSQLAIIPNQSHVSLVAETKLLLAYINNFLQ